MTLAWVIGGSGLLGRALGCALARSGAESFVPSERFRWTEPARLAEQMAAAVHGFAARAGSAQRWEIYWAAGVGTMSSRRAELAPETAALARLLECLADEPALRPMQGGLAFASSAGAIYAGALGEIVTEDTPESPTTEYAHEKLAQEAMLRDFASTHPRLAVLNARLSTLYGPGQSQAKRQGLLTSIARGILRNQPVQIYVPYDTIRDYLHVDDAAAGMITALCAGGAPAPRHTKIIASEQPTTIAQIISTFKRLSRRHPRIVTSATAASALYARKVQFRSVVSPRDMPRRGKSLVVGIAQLLHDERDAMVRGRSRTPPAPVFPRGRHG